MGVTVNETEKITHCHVGQIEKTHVRLLFYKQCTTRAERDETEHY